MRVFHFKKLCNHGNVILPTALVDMYCRCGCVKAALEVFRRVSSKDVVLWNVMIGGLAMHGHGRLAVDPFALMKETTTALNEFTYIAAMFAQTVHIVLVCTKPKMARALPEFSYESSPLHRDSPTSHRLSIRDSSKSTTRNESRQSLREASLHTPPTSLSATEVG
ncbi:Pentatricopeptide repeat-containing protein [Platanthera zijinensis]|uniref:Pentatricopeptide repeat-containing protein n=1 Tax=Platanthera zijinensis TaxID=2320716 RepID=A0AAP0GGL2_9ASPA